MRSTRKLLNDSDKWESREYGATEEFVRKASRKQEAGIDATLGLEPITIRLQKDLVSQLRRLAKGAGLLYQPYIRYVLTDHVKEQKRIAAELHAKPIRRTAKKKSSVSKSRKLKN